MTKATRFALFAAPLAMTGYGVVRYVGRLDDAYGPGFDWQLAHVLGLAGFVLFVPVVLGLRRMLPAGPWREVAAGAALFGLATSMVQFAVDIVQAFRAADKAELQSLQNDFTELPGVQAVIYDFGPLFFFVGLVTLAALAVRAGRLPWWSPVVLLIGVLLPLVTLDLMPVTGVLTLAALLPLTREARREAAPVG
ncbi:DUF4386 family protein [Actinoplanes sp. NPDC024001]|uniref:DUF4386 family protein n=1 Tax=Actinoplanes sp. NPDC024001 TaxID=3154598 RepID=UPI0034031EC1